MKIKFDELNPFFRETFSFFASSYLLPDEEIILLYNVCFICDWKSPYFPIGFLAISINRLFIVYIYSEVNGTTYYEPINRSVWTREITGKYHYIDSNEYIITPLSSQLTEFEKNSIEVFEYPVKYLYNVTKNSLLMRVNKKLPFPPNSEGFFIALNLFFWPDITRKVVFYDQQQAKEVYMYIQQLISKNHSLSNLVNQ